MVESVVLFYGPDREFDKLLGERIDSESETTVEFLALIRKYNYLVRSNDYGTKDYELAAKSVADNGVVRTADFGSVLDHVISNFAAIVTQAYDVTNLYVQNPPERARRSLASAYPDSIEEIRFRYQSVDKRELPRIYSELNEGVLGQSECKREIALALYKTSALRDGRPVVLMFYGPSGVGKTEAARCISASLGGRLTRVQISMMRTEEAYEYIFGGAHSKGSFARDLLSRESNIVLMDEFDKVHPSLYNAFYQLFDEGVFVDTNYEVEMREGVFILTSNFMSEKEIKQALGSALFSRISACISFDDLPDEAKRTIASRHYRYILDCLDCEDRTIIAETNMEAWFNDHASEYDNMRIMKQKIERAIFGCLTDRVLGDRPS